MIEKKPHRTLLDLMPFYYSLMFYVEHCVTQCYLPNCFPAAAPQPPPNDPATVPSIEPNGLPAWLLICVSYMLA